MKTINKVVIGLLAAMALSWAQAAYAVDNLTEFGIEDDLTVLGTGGSDTDPDLEVKGFSVFGATRSALNIPAAPGSMFVRGYVEVSSGMYVAGNSTFTAAVYLPAPTSIFPSGGTADQVMSKNATTGAMQWATVSNLVSGDNLGTHIATETLKMANFGIVNVASITTNGYIQAGASVTIAGTGGVGLGVTGTTALNGNTSVSGSNTFTVGTGAASFGGTVSATDNVTLSSNTAIGGAINNNERLKVVGGTASGNYAATFYSGSSLAAWIKKK